MIGIKIDKKERDNMYRDKYTFTLRFIITEGCYSEETFKALVRRNEKEPEIVIEAYLLDDFLTYLNYNRLSKAGDIFNIIRDYGLKITEGIEYIEDLQRLGDFLWAGFSKKEIDFIESNEEIIKEEVSEGELKETRKIVKELFVKI